MKIFKVVRFGCDHDPDGVNGVDTIFLVRSHDYYSAAEIVDESLERLPHEKVEPFSHIVFVIGADTSQLEEPMIIMGPSYEHAYNHGDYPGWERRVKSDDWEEITED